MLTLLFCCAHPGKVTGHDYCAHPEQDNDGGDWLYHGQVSLIQFDMRWSSSQPACLSARKSSGIAKVCAMQLFSAGQQVWLHFTIATY